MSEAQIQRAILLAIGAIPGLIVLRNSVGVARYTGDDGRTATVRYGLGVGSPDLVCLHAGRCFGLEVKRPGERPTPEQVQCHAAWERVAGVRTWVVTSVDEAKSAVTEAITCAK